MEGNGDVFFYIVLFFVAVFVLVMLFAKAIERRSRETYFFG